MASYVVEKRFDWKGPAAGRLNRSLLRRLIELLVPPKGHKVLPTASGMLLIFIGLTIGLAAYNTENNILFAALALLISSLILSGIICWGNLLCARWRLETSGTFRVGETGEAMIVLENARQRFPLFCLSFGLETETAEKSARLYLTERLDPMEQTTLYWRFKPEKRMKTAIRVRDVVSNFPFGFLSKHLAGESETVIKVWPKRISYARYRRTGLSGALQGRSSKQKGNSGELIGLRHYERGDTPRMIHWKVSAKQGRLIVKQNAVETQPVYSIVVDPSQYLWKDEESFERMCSFAASLAEDLFLESKLNDCLIVGGPNIRIQRVLDLETFFDHMAELEPKADGELPIDHTLVNRIQFRPTTKDRVGAFVNDVQIAQA